MNEPQFKIHGIERRLVKKELSELKSYVKNFWHHHQLDKDMTSFYGNKKNYPMSDEEVQKKFDEANSKIKHLENKLSIPYKDKMSMLEKLKKHLEETPREKLLEEWEEMKEWDGVGPTVEEFINKKNGNYFIKLQK